MGGPLNPAPTPRTLADEVQLLAQHHDAAIRAIRSTRHALTETARYDVLTYLTCEINDALAADVWSLNAIETGPCTVCGGSSPCPLDEPTR